MKPQLAICALLALGGCAVSKPPPLAMPSPQAPRVAINKPAPKALAAAAITAAARPVPVFQVLQSDGTVAAMLARWARDNGWTLRWEGVPDIAVTGDSRVDKPDFLSAADAVVTAIRAQGYSIKAKAFSDNVLEIRKAD